MIALHRSKPGLPLPMICTIFTTCTLSDQLWTNITLALFRLLSGYFLGLRTQYLTMNHYKISEIHHRQIARIVVN